MFVSSPDALSLIASSLPAVALLAWEDACLAGASGPTWPVGAVALFTVRAELSRRGV